MRAPQSALPSAGEVCTRSNKPNRLNSEGSGASSFAAFRSCVRAGIGSIFHVAPTFGRVWVKIGGCDIVNVGSTPIVPFHARHGGPLPTIRRHGRSDDACFLCAPTVDVDDLVLPRCNWIAGFAAADGRFRVITDHHGVIDLSLSSSDVDPKSPSEGFLPLTVALSRCGHREYQPGLPPRPTSTCYCWACWPTEKLAKHRVSMPICLGLPE